MKTAIRKSLVLFLSMVMILSSSIISFGAEDNQAPLLMEAKVTTASVKAGNKAKINIKVKEEGTGLKKAMITLRSADEPGQMVKFLYGETTSFSKTVSSGTNYIDYTFNISTTSSTKNGIWNIGYIELYDKKGNYSRYNYSENEKLLIPDLGVLESIDGSNASFTVSGGTGDNKAPVITSIKISTPEVVKPGTLKVSVGVDDATKLTYAQFNLWNKEDHTEYTYNNFSITKKATIYTFSIPITQKQHNGIWEIRDLFIIDNNENEARYTNQYTTSTDEVLFHNQLDASAKSFQVPTFVVTGIKGDETKPKLNSITLKNDSTIYKPGTLQFELDITEEETGVSNIMVEVDCISSDTIDIGSRVLYRYSAKGYSYDNTLESSSDITEEFYDSPLMTGKYTFTVPIPSTVENGRYKVFVYQLRDAADNILQDGAGFIGDDPTQYAIFDVADEFDYYSEISIGDDEYICEKIREMSEGQALRLLLSDTATDNILGPSVFNAIAGKDITLVCYKEGYQWIFNGKDVDQAKSKAINLNTKIYTVDGEYLSSGEKAVCVSFKNNGELPGKVQFRFKSAFVKSFVGKEDQLHFYHVDEDGNVEYSGDVEEPIVDDPTIEEPGDDEETPVIEDDSDDEIDYIDDAYDEMDSDETNIQVVVDGSDAWCYVDVTHNSKYLLTSAEIGKLTMANSKIANLNEYTYTGKTISPAFKITLGGRPLVKNVDYTIKYSNNKSIGTAKAVVTGITFEGSKTFEYKIIPKGTTQKKISAGKKCLTVKWSKQSAKMYKSKSSKARIGGYQIEYSKSSKFASGNKKVKVKGYSKTSKKITKLTSKKKYYVRVRTYMKVGSKTYYSKWSKVRYATAK